MGALGIQQYAINSQLFLGVIQDKYISLYRELVAQLHTYVSAIRVLAKGYLPNTLLTPKNYKEFWQRSRNHFTALIQIIP